MDQKVTPYLLYVDAHHERATATGATVIEELNDLPFGHRRYGCEDPQGHQWYFATPIATQQPGS